MVDRQVTSDSGRQPMKVAVISPKGGVGRTMIASNLATVLARTTPTVLIDTDVYCGDIEFALGLRPVYRLDDLVLQSTTNPDLEFVSMLTRWGDNLAVACAPKNPFMADQMESRATWGVVKSIVDNSRCALIDTGPGLGPLTISAMDTATRIILVCGTDTASVNAARTTLSVIDQLALDRGKVILVANRPAPKAGLHLDDVANILGMRPNVIIPEDPVVAISMNKGTPVVDMSPSSAPSRSIQSLAASIRETELQNTTQTTQGEA